MHVFDSLGSVAGAVGTELGVSDWLRIDQQLIDAFAQLTGDRQWIHVDSVRAANGPFGSTIAHGYLTLGLVADLGRQVFRLETPGIKINYGVDRVRFLQPVRSGDRIRTRVSFNDLRPTRAGHLLTVHHEVGIEGSAKPAAVIDALILLANEQTDHAKRPGRTASATDPPSISAS